MLTIITRSEEIMRHVGTRSEYSQMLSYLGANHAWENVQRFRTSSNTAAIRMQHEHAQIYDILPRGWEEDCVCSICFRLVSPECGIPGDKEFHCDQHREIKSCDGSYEPMCRFCNSLADEAAENIEIDCGY